MVPPQRSSYSIERKTDKRRGSSISGGIKRVMQERREGCWGDHRRSREEATSTLEDLQKAGAQHGGCRERGSVQVQETACVKAWRREYDLLEELRIVHCN